MWTHKTKTIGWFWAIFLTRFITVGSATLNVSDTGHTILILNSLKKIMSWYTHTLIHCALLLIVNLIWPAPSSSGGCDFPAMVDCNLETATRWTLAPLSCCGLGPLLQQQKGVWESGHRYAQHDLLIVNHETEPNTGLTMCLETKFPTSQYSVGSGSPATLQERVTEFPSSTVRLGAARRADGRPMREKSTQKCSYSQNQMARHTHVFTEACFLLLFCFSGSHLSLETCHQT